MTLHVPITSEVESRLRARAEQAGKDIASYAADLLERASRAPAPLQEISGPIGEEFARSGLSEDQLADLLEAEKHEARVGLKRQPISEV